MNYTKRLKLEDFISLTQTTKDLFCDIILDGTEEESKMLECFCNIKLKRRRFEEAWSHIIYFISENIHLFDVSEFLTEKTLNFLIEQKIALNELGHLKLKDKWLLKIYEKDNNCIEALQTVESRKNSN